MTSASAILLDLVFRWRHSEKWGCFKESQGVAIEINKLTTTPTFVNIQFYCYFISMRDAGYKGRGKFIICFPLQRPGPFSLFLLSYWLNLAALFPTRNYLTS